MGVQKKIRPISVNTDVDELLMKDEEARFIKNYRIDQGPNANLSTGTGSGAPSGANFGMRVKLLSNKPVYDGVTPLLPAGKNKKIGGGYCDVTNEYYYFNQNANGDHGIYVIYGETMAIDKVLVDPELNFSANPLYEIPQHDMELWIVYDSDDIATRKIKEKYLIWTDSKNWQGFLNVIAAIKTNGFDASLFPYWTLKQPHFDRRELFELAVRPIMPAPVVATVERNDADKGKHNGLLLRSFQFAVEQFYTDGRPSTLSQWSEPVFVDKSTCNLNSQNLIRCYDLTFMVGSPMTERIRILVKNCSGDWYAVETINKFTSCDENDPAIIGEDYWLRTNPWKDYFYDTVFNKITYRFCNNKECKLVSQVDAMRFQSDLPIKSTAASAIGDSMGFADNLYGYDNLPCEVTKNFELSISDVITQNECVVTTRKITLYAFIGRGNLEGGYINQPGYKTTSETPVRWGGCFRFNDGSLAVDIGENDMFNLDFGDKQGPLMYLAGTPYYAIGKQMLVDVGLNKTEVGIFDFDIQANKNFVIDSWNNGSYFIWQFDFVVPAGKYIARMAGHQARESDDYKKTSTYLFGLTTASVKPPGELIYGTTSSTKEKEIDCCNADYDPWHTANDLFLVFAPYDYKEEGNRRWRFITGNVYEDSKDKLPVELVRYITDQGYPEYSRTGFTTDHNGFYFAYTARGEAKKANVVFWSKFNCVLHYQNTWIAKTSGLPNKDRGFYPNTNIYLDNFNSGKFGDCNRVLVRGRVMDCDNKLGLEGIAVTISRGSTVFTLPDGTFELVVHNSFEQVRTDRIYFNTGGVCLFGTCDCLCPVIENYNDASVPCVICDVRVYPTTLTRNYRLVIKQLKSMKGGGRYGVGAEVWDLAGRGGFINNLGYLDVKTFLEKKKVSQSFLAWKLNAPLGLSPEIKWFSFFRTGNLNYTSYLQWVGDSIEFLDVNGMVVVSPSQAIRARVSIQSLNDFNKAQTFGNTTNYQFVPGDILRIYDDGNNNMFDPITTDGFLDYDILGTNWGQANEDLGVVETTVVTGTTTTKTTVPKQDGKSFLIPFDKRLVPLQKSCGFWIEIMRLKSCAAPQKYCEVATMYPVINGEIVTFDGFDSSNQPIYTPVMSGILNTWDTYFQKRFLKIKGCGGKLFNHPFESASISDYWGADCGSCGREWIENENANQRWYQSDVIRSDAFVNDGGYNGLGTYRESNRRKFKGQHRGSIVAMRANDSVIVFVCTDGWFMSDYNINSLRVSEAGLVITSPEDTISDPRQKIDDTFGVSMDNKGAVIFEDKFVSWPDNKRGGIIVMDFRTATDISDIDNKSYFNDKFDFVNRYNNSLSPAMYEANVIDTIFGYDAEFKELLVTFRPRRNNTENVLSFVNDERETFTDMNETFVFHMDMKKWVRYPGYTPEGYGSIPKGKYGKELLSFINGMPYRHNSSDVNTFNTFYGVKTQALMRIIYNESSSKEKILQAVTVESNNHKHIITDIRTNEINCFSYVPESYFKKKENIWYANFLRDMNSYPSTDPVLAFQMMLIDGKRLFGTFFDMTIVADLLKLDEYSETNFIILKAIGSELSDK